MKYWLVGIKGTGMSALACILSSLNYEVLGSDVKDYYFTEKALRSSNIKYFEFNKNNIRNNNKCFYIISNAYDKSNVEVNEIINKEYKYMYYSEFINYFFKGIKIGISGMHGKTTTTSMCVKLFEDERICALIGNGTGIGMDNYKYFIFEACEYRNNFLKYDYDYLIINNIDYDHVDFFDSIEQVIESFQIAAKKSRFIICNNDDLYSRNIEHKNKITFGKSFDSDYVISKINKYKDGFVIQVVSKYAEEIIKVPLVGEHNIYNFVAAYVLTKELNINVNIQDKIYHFKMPKRRMEEYIFKNNIIIDDYAHHPKEIKCLLESIKQKYDKDIIVIFQPHTYSRTIKLEKEFRNLFDEVELFLCNTYTSVREQKSDILEEKVKSIFPKSKEYSQSTIKYLNNVYNKVIVFLGAGIISNDINKLLYVN